MNRDSSRHSLQGDDAVGRSAAMLQSAQSAPPAPIRRQPPESFERQFNVSAFQRRNFNPTVGNGGFYYANFGPRAKNIHIQNGIDAQLKRNPALMMFLSELPKPTDDMLKMAPRDGVPEIPAEHMNDAVTVSYTHLTLPTKA